MKSVLIIGIGEFGKNIAKEMNNLGCEVMAVDISEPHINEILPYVTNAIIGNSTSREFVKSLSVHEYDVCIVSVGNHFQTLLETTTLVKELGAKRVIARASDDVQMKFLLRNGADEVVYPEKQMAMRIATKYASDSILDFVQLDNNYTLYQMKAPKEWYGQTVQQLDVRKKYNINIISIKRGIGVFMPAAETEIIPEDKVFVMGEVESIKRCFNL
ncbi:MAG: TrkA family potassium uptake protein [Clostridia bacterium]|nr:TrkA family potassium uptake protein [Clostridia bacterium]MBQ3463172.1 TrkA family potassium uptake protein [Clostridia bacterium]MBQ3471792.1 TrkA family potassium uptake protein [Clostridia bacterium]MBQ6531144.1 TrkA family potassium uptake protein [Clostridia bacterium]MBQ6558469.1 TrkA family potassium uptake protein [Clostridia bacterium]